MNRRPKASVSLRSIGLQRVQLWQRSRELAGELIEAKDVRPTGRKRPDDAGSKVVGVLHVGEGNPTALDLSLICGARHRRHQLLGQASLTHAPRAGNREQQRFAVSGEAVRDLGQLVLASDESV